MELLEAIEVTNRFLDIETIDRKELLSKLDTESFKFEGVTVTVTKIKYLTTNKQQTFIEFDTRYQNYLYKGNLKGLKTIINNHSFNGIKELNELNIEVR